jgi:hypothetical protein
MDLMILYRHESHPGSRFSNTQHQHPGQRELYIDQQVNIGSLRKRRWPGIRFEDSRAATEEMRVLYTALHIIKKS